MATPNIPDLPPLPESAQKSPGMFTFLSKLLEVVRRIRLYINDNLTGIATLTSDKVDKTTQVLAGTGLSGGGTLDADVTLAVTYSSNTPQSVSAQAGSAGSAATVARSDHAHPLSSAPTIPSFSHAQHGHLASNSGGLLSAASIGSGTIPILHGGTGASDASTALTNLGAEPAITAGTTSQYWRGDKTWQTWSSSVVGLGNVTNDAQVKRTEMGMANGVATLDVSALLPVAQLPASAYRSGGTDVAITDGGTGASDASTARSNLGAQAADATLTALAGLDASTGYLYQTGSDAFIKMASQFDDFFEIDINGNLIPAASPTTSLVWELDGSGNIVPKAA